MWIIHIDLSQSEDSPSAKLSDDNQPAIFNLSVAYTGIFWENYVNIMAVDALDPCVSMLSATLSFTMYD